MKLFGRSNDLLSQFLTSSLLVILHTDALSATDAKCEIQPSCFPSSCQHTDPMTVDPDSNITLNCSIITAGLERGMTWRQAKTKIHNNTGSPDLVLLQFNSTKFSDTKSCDCTNIHFRRAPKVVWISETPSFIYEGNKPKDLECFFSGWPLAFDVHWFKDGKIIANGTEGIYHSEDTRRKNGEETLHSRLSLPPGREELEGIYKCSAKNKISGQRASYSFQYIFVCPKPKGPTIVSDPEVLARTFSTVRLTCLSDVDNKMCPTQLIWHNDTAPLESSTKYQIEQKKMRSKCKLQSILSIVNVTEGDEGNYSCNWNCDSGVAAVHLKVFFQSQTAQVTEFEGMTTSPNLGSGNGSEWLLAIIIISAASASIFLMFFVHF